MKKSVWITIIIVIILIILTVLIFSGSNTQNTQDNAGDTNSEEAPLQDYTDLQTDDDVFAAIDDSFELIE